MSGGALVSSGAFVARSHLGATETRRAAEGALRSPEKRKDRSQRYPRQRLTRARMTPTRTHRIAQRLACHASPHLHARKDVDISMRLAIAPPASRPARSAHRHTRKGAATACRRGEAREPAARDERAPLRHLHQKHAPRQHRIRGVFFSACCVRSFRSASARSRLRAASA